MWENSVELKATDPIYVLNCVLNSISVWKDWNLPIVNRLPVLLSCSIITFLANAEKIDENNYGKRKRASV